MVRASAEARPSALPASVPPGGISDAEDSDAAEVQAQRTLPAAGAMQLRAAKAAKAAHAARVARGSIEALPSDAFRHDGTSPATIRDLIAINQDPLSSGLFPLHLQSNQPNASNLPVLPPLHPAGSDASLFGGLPGVTHEHIKETFDQIDYDGNGFIGVSELRYLLTMMGERPKDEELDEMLRLFDDDGNGQVDYEEFKQLFSPATPVLPEMLAMNPELATHDDVDDGSPRSSDAGFPLSRVSSQRSSYMPKEPPSPKEINLMMSGAHGFLHMVNKKQQAKERKVPMPKVKQAARGAHRARPGTPTQALPVSPRSVKRERQSYPHFAGGKGKGGQFKGKDMGKGMGPMQTTGMDPFGTTDRSTASGFKY